MNDIWHAISRKKGCISKKHCQKHCVINVLLVQLKKPGCNAFHSYDDADIDITKLSVQIP